ncbi:MAG: mechanosensitive ion channel family protein [Eubacteriales bacterium]
MEKLINLVLPVAKSILFAIVVLVVGHFVIKYINKRINKIVDNAKFDSTLKPFIKSFVSAALKILLVVAVISILGIETSSFVALFGTAGLAIGLAFQGTLSNFAGGVLILITKPFKVGDFIEATGYSGTVEGIQILYTNLVTPDNKVIHIPNGSLSNASIMNYSEKPMRRFQHNFRVAHDADHRKVIKVLTEVIENHPLILDDPKPFVRMTEHGDSAIVYTVRAWAKSEDFWTANFDVVELVKQRFDEEGLSIPHPQMDIHIKNTAE